MTRQIRNSFFGWSMALAGVLLATGAWAQQRTFNLPEQDATKSIPEFARQAGIQISASTDELKGMRTSPVRGELDVRVALQQLLQGTGLSVASDDGSMIVLKKAETGGQHGASAAAGLSQAMQLAQAGQTTKNAENDPAPPSAAQSAAESEEKKAEARKRSASTGEPDENTMIVTGTNIRGAGGPVGQRADIITREDILRAGIENMSELGEMITQNFGGGGGEPAVFNAGQQTASTITSTNSTYTSGFNLRGLGPGATLTLLNGRRLAPSGTSENFGVRAIPLNLVERVEIVPDGGSAIYGSDAVGGVVNVITRRDFTGVEATARRGAVTNGGYTQSSANLVAGQGWSSGNAFVYLDYSKEGRLDAGDRDYVSNELISPGSSLVPSGDRKGFFASVSQTLLPKLQLGLDLLWSEENTAYDIDASLLDGETPGSIGFRSRAKHASLRMDYALPRQWSLGGRLDRSVNQNDSEADNEFLGNPSQRYENTGTTFELSIGGPAFSLPAGAVQMAAGALRRQQKFFSADSFGTVRQLEREVTGAYGEFLVPLARNLKFNVAARWDDYGSFGDRITPKYGLSWRATNALTLRASFAEAFRAPAITQLEDRQRLNFQVANWYGRLPADQDPRVSEGQSYAAIFLRQGNPDLTPETARIFTAGFDLRPAAGLSIGITYFDIEYKDIIFFVFPNRLSNPDFADFITAYPDQALLQQRLAEAEAVGNFAGFPIDLGAVQVLLDAGNQNMSALTTSGFDINARYALDLGPGRLNLSVKSSYVFDYSLQATALSAPFNNVDRVGDPLRLNVRTTAAYGIGPWLFSLGMNYEGAYVDDIFAADPPAPQPVDSQTTFDVGVHYEVADASPRAAWAKGLGVSFNVRNVTDKDPPYVQDPLGFNFDAAHADVVGRFVSLQIRKSWGR